MILVVMIIGLLIAFAYESEVHLGDYRDSVRNKKNRP